MTYPFDTEPFDTRPLNGGVQHRFKFNNGWGASVVRGPWTHGGSEGLWELAVVGRDGNLHYANPVADGDVRGYLTEVEVDELLDQIETYPEGDLP